jgi:hypothetical protein
LKCFKKNLKKQKQKLLEIFSSSTDPQPSRWFQRLNCGPAKLENIFRKLKKNKIKIFLFLFCFQKYFQVWRACRLAEVEML